MPSRLFDDYLESALALSDNRRLEGDRDAFAEDLIFRGLAGEDPFGVYGTDLFGTAGNPFGFASQLARDVAEPATTAGGLLRAFSAGLVEGFTTLPLDGGADTTAERIAGSLGHLMGFVGILLPFGWMARGLGLAARVGVTGARGLAASASAAQRAGAGTVGGLLSKGLRTSAALAPNTRVAAGLSDAASRATRLRSVPMMISDAVQKRLFAGPAGQSLLKMLEGRPVLRQMVESGTHLGVAMAVSATPRAFLEEEDFLTGTVPRVLESALWGVAMGGILDTGLANLPGLNRMTTEAKVARAALGGFTQGAAAYAMGARDADLVYEALLGGYFGAMNVPWQVHHARQALFRAVPDPLRHVAHRTEEALDYADRLGLKGEERTTFLKALQEEAEGLYRPEEAAIALKRFFRRFSEAMRDNENSAWSAEDHEAFMRDLERIEVTGPAGDPGSPEERPSTVDELIDRMAASGGEEAARALARAKAAAVDEHASAAPMQNAAVRLAERMASVGPDGKRREPRRSEVLGIAQVITRAAREAPSFGAFQSRVERVYGEEIPAELLRDLKPFFTEVKARIEVPHYVFNAETGRVERLEMDPESGTAFAPNGDRLDTGAPIGLLHRVMVSDGLLPPEKAGLGEGVRIVDLAILPDPDGGPFPIQARTFEVDWEGARGAAMWRDLLGAMREEGYHLFSGVSSTGKFVFVPYNLGPGLQPELARIRAEFEAAGIDFDRALAEVVQVRAKAERRRPAEVREELLPELVSNVRYWERMNGAVREAPEAALRGAGLDLSGSTRKTRYFGKDQAKASRANKFIGRGSPSSSTEAYREAVSEVANTGVYTADDVVMISAEGARKGRVAPDFDEIQRAIDAGASFVTDAPKDRERSYNVGEREVAAFLESRGYVDDGTGFWQKPGARPAGGLRLRDLLSGEGHFIRDVLDFNKRTQIWSSNYYPVRPELLTFQSGVRKGQAMKPRFVLVDDQELFRPEYEGLTEADDGGAYAPGALMEALVEAGALPKGASYVKPFVETQLEGGGLFLGKLAFHQPLGALDEALMRAHPEGGLVLVPRSAAKQAATAKGYAYRLVQDEGGHRIEFGLRQEDGSVTWGVEPETHDLPAEAIRLSTGTVDDAPVKAGKGATFFRQLFSTLTPEQVGREAYDALERAVLETAWIGDPDANAVLRAYLREPGDPAKLRAVEERFADIGIEQWVRVLNEDPPEALRTLFYRRAVAEDAGLDLDTRAAEAFLDGWKTDEPVRERESTAQRVLRETDLALARLGKGLSTYQRQAVRSWLVKRLTNPTWRSAGKAVMSVTGVDTEAAGLRVTEEVFYLDRSHRNVAVRDPETGAWTTLGELFDAGRATDLEAVVARVPIDDVSGAQVLRFAGFTDLPGGGIYLHPLVKRRLGGADNDIDSANFYFGLPEAYREGLKRARLDQDVNADLIAQRKAELENPPDNLLMKSPLAMFDPLHRAFIANRVSHAQNRMTGTAVNARARLHAMFSAANQSRVVDPETGARTEGVLESRVYGPDEPLAGVTVRFYAADDDGVGLRALGSAAINMSVDVAKVGGMIPTDELQVRLLEAAFPRIELVVAGRRIRVTPRELYEGVVPPVKDRKRLLQLIKERDRIARNADIPEMARRAAAEQKQAEIDRLLTVTVDGPDGALVTVTLPERIDLFDTAYGRLGEVNQRLYGRDRSGPTPRPFSEDDVIGAFQRYPHEVGRTFLSDVAEKVAESRIDFGLLRSVLRDVDRLGAFLHAANNVLGHPDFRHLAPMLAGLDGSARLRIPYAQQMGILRVLARYYGEGAESGYDLSRDSGVEALARDRAAFDDFKEQLFRFFSPERQQAFDEAAETGRKAWGTRAAGPRDFQVRAGAEGGAFSQKAARITTGDGRTVTVEEAVREAYASREAALGRALTEDERRAIYQRAWDAWARQHPEQVEELARKTRGRRLVSPDFNRDGTNEAEALAEILSRRRRVVADTPEGRARAIRRLLEQTEHYIENDVRDVASVRTVAEFFDYAGRDEPLARHLMELAGRVREAYTAAMTTAREAGDVSVSLALSEVRAAYREAQAEVLRAVEARNRDPEVRGRLGVEGIDPQAALDLFDATVLSTVGHAEAAAGRARTAYHQLGPVMARRHVLAAFQKHYETALGMAVSSTKADVAARVRATDDQLRRFFGARLLEESPAEAMRRALRDEVPQIEGFGLRVDDTLPSTEGRGRKVPTDLEEALNDALAVLETYPALRENPAAIVDLFRGLTGKAEARAVTAQDVIGFASEVRRWKEGASFIQRLLRGDVAARLRAGQEAAKQSGKPWRWWHAMMFSETVGRELREKDLELVLSQNIERPGARRSFLVPTEDPSGVVKAARVSAGWADVRSRFERVVQITGLGLDQATQASERDEHELERRFEYLALGIDDIATGESGLEPLMRLAVREHEAEGTRAYLEHLKERYRLGAHVRGSDLEGVREDLARYEERLATLHEELGGVISEDGTHTPPAILSRVFVLREPGKEPVHLTGREVVDRIKRDIAEATDWLYENRVALSDEWLQRTLPTRRDARFGFDIDLEKVARSFVRIIDQGLQPVDVERDLGRLTHDQQAFFAYETLLHHLADRMAESDVRRPESPDEVTSLYYRREVSSLIEKLGLEEIRVLPQAERVERVRRAHREAQEAHKAEPTPENRQRRDDLYKLLQYFEARVGDDDPRRVWEGLSVYSQYDMDLALALGEITKERHFKAEMRQTKPFVRTPRRLGYFPHNGFDPELVLDEMVRLTEEARDHFEKKVASLDELGLSDRERELEYERAYQRFEERAAAIRVKALAVAGKTADPDDLMAVYARAAVTESESLEATAALLESFGAERRGGFAKARTLDFPGYDETVSALFRYAGQVARATYKGLAATLSLNAIRSFEKRAPYGDEDSRAWGRWMRLHVRDALGYPSLLPDEYLSDAAFPLRKSPYYWLSDEAAARRGGRFNRLLVRLSGLHRLSKQEREALGVVRGRPLLDEEVEALEAERLERMSRDPDVLAERYKRASELEGKYEMATLLFSMKTGVANVIGGATNTYIWTGAAPMVEARRFETWKRINPAWESMEDVYKWAYELGVVEEFMRHEVGAEQAFQDRRARAFWEEAMSKIRENPSWGTAQEVRALASRHGLTDRFVETTAFFMQRTERTLRLHAFLSGYLEARRTLGDPLDLDVSDPYLVEAGKRAVKATQFLYSVPFRPAFSRTAWGKVFSRFKLWSWNSVVFRRQVMEEAASAGYRPGSPEFERLQRLLTADLFVIGLAGLLPYTLFEHNLPAPYSYMQDLAEYLLGDEEERRRAFFGTHSVWPYPLTPLQEVTPPIARLAAIPVDAFNRAMDRVMGRSDETGSLYLYATLFPGGRLARDLSRSVGDLARAPEYLTGIPFTSMGYLQREHRDRAQRARALPGVMRALAESADGLTQNELVALMQTEKDKSAARKALRDALESGLVVRTREKRGAGGAPVYVYRVAGEGGQALRRDILMASVPSAASLFEGATGGLRGF